MSKCKFFHIIMIRPTRYGPDGYPLQWFKTFIPSNTLACIYALAADSRDRFILGKDVEIRLHAIDETVQRVNYQQLLREIGTAGKGRGMVMMVGVQTNQFPRAVDLSRPFVEAKIPVCIGGFHVSGCMAMFGRLTPELEAANNMGISFFAGEAEDRRLDELIHDAFTGNLKPVYDHLRDLPALTGAPPPFLPPEQRLHNFNLYATMDLGRGCPFGCSFCTVINVQGRKSRARSADDMELVIRRYQDNTNIPFERNPLLRWFFKTKAVKRETLFFLTDDNFSRNSKWEELLDRLITLRREEGFKIRLQIQVDAGCHRIPGFIEKCVSAGVDQVFIGIESINQNNLAEVKKTQNLIDEYRDTILAWKKHPVVVYAAYIIGFPQETRASVLADIETLKRELAIDLIHFTILTPLPGSEDHRKMIESGAWMDSDLNKYALCNRVTRHAQLSIEEWENVYRTAYECFYTDEHIETILKRMIALGSNKKKTTIGAIMIYAHAYRTYAIHPLEVGFFRRKRRKDRQTGKPVENPFTFYSKHLWESFAITTRTYLHLSRLHRKLNDLWTDPKRYTYTDTSMQLKKPPTEQS